MDGASPAEPPIPSRGPRGPSRSRRSEGGGRLLVVVLIVSVVFGAGGAALGVFLRSADRLGRGAARPVPAPETAPRAIPPAGLHSRPDTGWHLLDVPAPAGEWATFDPVANVEWAQSIARGWNADAVLTRVHVARLAASGTVNLADGREEQAAYQFVSPARIAEWSERAARGESGARVGYELMVVVARRMVEGMVTFGRPLTRDVPADAVVSLPLAALLEGAMANRKFQESSYYDVDLLHHARDGWVWYVQARGQLEASPRVRARDGAVYPYRR